MYKRQAPLSELRTARTRLTWHQASRTFTVHAVDGAVDVVPAEREWKVTFLSLRDKGARYSVTGIVSREQTSSFAIDVEPVMATPNKRDALFEVLNRAQYSHSGKEHIWWLINNSSGELEKVQALRAMDAPQCLIDSLVEILGAV